MVLQKEIPEKPENDIVLSTSDSFAPPSTSNKSSENEIMQQSLQNETVLVLKYDIGDYFVENKIKGIDDFTKYQLLSNHWQPPKEYVFPYSLHTKKGKEEKRRINYELMKKFKWLVFSEKKKGLFCISCALFMSDFKVGGQKTVVPQKFVIHPLQNYSKLTGKDGDLIKHQTHLYHIQAEQKGEFYHHLHKKKLNVFFFSSQIFSCCISE